MLRPLLYRLSEIFASWSSLNSCPRLNRPWTSWLRLVSAAWQLRPPKCNLRKQRTYMTCEMLLLTHSQAWSMELNARAMNNRISHSSTYLSSRVPLLTCSSSLRAWWLSRTSKLTLRQPCRYSTFTQTSACWQSKRTTTISETVQSSSKANNSPCRSSNLIYTITSRPSLETGHLRSTNSTKERQCKDSKDVHIN